MNKIKANLYIQVGFLTLVTKVKGILLYKSFEDILDDYPIELLSDYDTSKDELINTLNTFYSREKQEQYGVIGIRVKLI